MTEVARSLGHDVVAVESPSPAIGAGDPRAIAGAGDRRRCHEDAEHALELVEEIVDEASAR